MPTHQFAIVDVPAYSPGHPIAVITDYFCSNALAAVVGDDIAVDYTSYGNKYAAFYVVCT
jgi:hypothetical protein